MFRYARLGTCAAVVPALLAVASPADATPPTRFFVTAHNSGIATDLCAFPVTIDSTVSGTVMLQDDGATTTASATGTAQDTLSANGVTLIGETYHFRISLVSDDATGNVIGGFAGGIAEKVPLPDGRLFVTAGRVNIALHPDQEITIVPDVGNTGDLAALCAALA